MPDKATAKLVFFFAILFAVNTEKQNFIHWEKTVKINPLRNMQHLKYPIGPFEKKDHYTGDEFAALVSVLENAPEQYRKIAEKLNAKDLAKTYREGSWTVLQLVHHVADIQLLHFLRMKKVLTEPNSENTTIIDMDEWAKTPDAIQAPIRDSLIMFEGISRRYAFLIRSLDDASLKIEYFHPVRKFSISQAQAVAMSAWHVRHHLAHIKLALGISKYFKT